MYTSILLLFTILFSRPEKTTNINVSIPNIKSTKGVIEIGIFDTSEKFPKVGMTCRTARFKINSQTETFTIENIREGEYAVAIYHDENSDGVCNCNFLGIPLEGYGFSNNVKPVFRAPAFEDCKISVPENSNITIRLIY